MLGIEYVKDRHIATLLVILLLLGFAAYYYGIHLGIEFSGGTEIPITLAHSVDPNTMSSLLSTLQQRISTFGLKQVTIEGIGDSQVYLIIPSVNPGDINNTIGVIEQQGLFQGVVAGREALNGSAILGGSGEIQPSYSVSGSNVTWIVNFYITQAAAQSFSKVVFGQANQPLYMYLDRPTGAIVLLNNSLLGVAGAGQNAELTAMESALALGNQTIPVKLLNSNQSNWNSLSAYFAQSRSRYYQVVLANNTSPSIIQNLTRLNYTLIRESTTQMTPVFISQSSLNSSTILDTWPALGLLSAPVLNPSITNGEVGEAYAISGVAQPASTVAGEIANANNQSQTIASVLSGGALPVSVIVGTPFTTPPTLGKSFEYISILALLLAVLAVAITIAIRYKRLFLIWPIVFTTVAELFIIATIIGVIGTIDLSAVAGMIAVIGTGVDAQIIITDEVLHGGSESFKSKLNHAFYVVWADAILLVIAMLPLLFSSSLVSVIGFAESTILGGLLGALITRPAYGAIVSRHFAKGTKVE